MNTILSSRCVVIATALLAFFAVGCDTPKPGPNPLVGWKLLSEGAKKPDKSILDDYQDYIQKLPIDERQAAKEFNPQFLEDGTGRHAVRVSFPLSGTWWEHVLIYDQNNRRMQALKRVVGHYQS